MQVTVKARLSPDDLACACAEAIWKEDAASGALAGQTTLTMTVRPDMVNGQRIAYGGFIFALADSAFWPSPAAHSARRHRLGQYHLRQAE